MRRELFLQLRSLLLARSAAGTVVHRPATASSRAPAFSSSAVERLLPEQWRGDEYVRTPPVRLFDGAAEAPTALAWLRRRAPGASSASAAAASSAAPPPPPPPCAFLYRLFRTRQIRLARLVAGDGAAQPASAVRVTRIASPSRVLEEGDVLLLPRAALSGAAGDEDERPRQERPRQAAAADAAPRSPAATSVRPSEVRSWVLAKHPDFFVLDKPAGVKVHGLEPPPTWRRRRQHGGGGGGGNDAPPPPPTLPPTLDLATGVLGRALGRPGDADVGGGGPRPVHRLDQRASGCLVVARDRDAAAWLGAAFGRSSAASGAEGGGGGGGADGERRSAPRVEKTYWALVEARPGSGDDKTASLLTAAAASRGGGGGGGGGGGNGGGWGTLRTRDRVVRGRPRWSVTKYRVLAAGKAPPSATTTAAAAAAAAGAAAALPPPPLPLLVELAPRTGRKHQLRRHLAWRLGAPIVGDWRYGWSGGGGGGWASEEEDEEGDDEDDAYDERRRRRRRRRRRGPADADDEEGGAAAQENSRETPLERLLARAAAAAALPPPLLLHARELVVHRPGAPPLRAIAPLPAYFRSALRACGIDVSKDRR